MSEMLEHFIYRPFVSAYLMRTHLARDSGDGLGYGRERGKLEGASTKEVRKITGSGRDG